jgi:hypothetical protein
MAESTIAIYTVSNHFAQIRIHVTCAEERFALRFASHLVTPSAIDAGGVLFMLHAAL